MNYKDIDFEEIIQMFNSEGKEATKRYVETTYNTSYPNIQRRFKEETNYYYNRNTKKYEPIEESEKQFMTLKELYTEKTLETMKINEDRPNLGLNPPLGEDIFKEVVVNLMKDKMQEISKYIQLEQSTKRAIINLKKLKQNGYEVILD